MANKPQISGQIGHVPPAHAPRESTLDSRPMTTEEVEAQMALARRHEKTLPPLAPRAEDQMRLPPGVKPGDPDAVEQTRAWIAAGAPGEWPISPKMAEIAPEIASDPALAAVDTALAVLEAAKVPAAARPSVVETPAAAPEPYRPAASDSESPARGIPKPIADAGKAITGGFGVASAAGSGDYIPLDGNELCALAQGLLVDLAERLSKDLRFSIAVTYPRVRCRVELIVESFMVDSDFRVQTVAVEKGETALEVARALGDEICFVVVNQRQEVDARGNAESPANAMRGELGLEIPRKQVIATPTGTVVVDRRN